MITDLPMFNFSECTVDPTKVSEAFTNLSKALDHKGVIMLEGICNPEKSLEESLEMLVRYSEKNYYGSILICNFLELIQSTLS
jgi:hypothetical protein